MTGPRPTPTPEQLRIQRSRAGTLGALVSWGHTPDRERRTRAAREAAFRRFLNEVPPEITDPAERERAAECLRLAHMRRLSLRAAEARRAKAARSRST
jgi:hypothetical protein